MSVNERFRRVWETRSSSIKRARGTQAGSRGDWEWTISLRYEGPDNRAKHGIPWVCRCGMPCACVCVCVCVCLRLVLGRYSGYRTVLDWTGV